MCLYYRYQKPWWLYQRISVHLRPTRPVSESRPIELASKLQTLTKPSLDRDENPSFWHGIQFDQFQNYNPQIYMKWILKMKIWTKYSMISLQICPYCVSILNSMLFLFIFSDFKISSMFFFIILKKTKVHWSSEFRRHPWPSQVPSLGKAGGRRETCQPGISTWEPEHGGIPRIPWKRRF